MNADIGSGSQHDTELEQRLRQLEGDDRHQMVQPALPARDVLWLVASLVVVSVVLVWWAR